MTGAQNQFDRLIAAVCDGRATQGQWEELAGILKRDPRAVDHYLQSIDLHASLAGVLSLAAVGGRHVERAQPSVRVVPAEKFRRRHQAARACAAAVVTMAMVVAAFAWTSQQAIEQPQSLELTILLRAAEPIPQSVEVEMNGGAGVGFGDAPKDPLADNSGQDDRSDRQDRPAWRLTSTRSSRMLPARYEVPRKFQKVARPRRYTATAAATLPTAASARGERQRRSASRELSIEEPSWVTEDRVVDGVRHWGANDLAYCLPWWRRNWDTELSMRLDSLLLDWRRNNGD